MAVAIYFIRHEILGFFGNGFINTLSSHSKPLPSSFGTKSSNTNHRIANRPL